MRKLAHCQKTGEVFSLSPALKAATADIITTYSFGKSADDYLKADNNDAPFFSPSMELLPMVHWFTHIAWLNPLLEFLPRKLVAFLNSDLAGLFGMQDVSDDRYCSIERTVGSQRYRNGKTKSNK